MKSKEGSSPITIKVWSERQTSVKDHVMSQSRVGRNLCKVQLSQRRLGDGRNHRHRSNECSTSLFNQLCRMNGEKSELRKSCRRVLSTDLFNDETRIDLMTNFFDTCTASTFGSECWVVERGWVERGSSGGLRGDGREGERRGGLGHCGRK